MDNPTTKAGPGTTPKPNYLQRGSEEYWQLEIQKALAWRKKCSFEERWDHYRDYYMHKIDGAPRQPVFNAIYLFGSALAPLLVFNRPGIINTARRPDFTFWSQFYDSIDNVWVDEAEVKSTIEELILNCYLYNTSSVWIGYDFPESLSTLEKLAFKPVKGSVDRTRKENMPWLDVVPPSKLLLALGTTSIRNCRWAGKFMSIPVRLLKEKNGVVKANVVATSIPDEVLKHTGNKWLEEALEMEGYCHMYEIHDAEKEEWFVISSDGKFIIEPREDPLQVDGLPCELLAFNPAPDSVWGTPDVTYIESQYLEGNECRRDGRLQRKFALIKALYDRDCLKAEQLEKLLSGDVAPFIAIENLRPDTKVSDKVALLQPHVQIEYFEYQKNLLNDMELLLKFGPNQLGMFAQGRRTAAETEKVAASNAIGADYRRNKVAAVIERLVLKVNRLIAKHWKFDVVQKVIGLEGALYWVNARPSGFEEIETGLVTKVNVESMKPVSQEERRREISEVLGVLAKMQGVNTLPIIMKLLTTFDWVDTTSVLPMANAQQMGQPEFQQRQQDMMRNPQLGEMASRNMGALRQAPPQANRRVGSEGVSNVRNIPAKGGR